MPDDHDDGGDDDGAQRDLDERRSQRDVEEALADMPMLISAPSAAARPTSSAALEPAM